MAKRLVFSILLLFTFLSAGAQNNPFDIDDECYTCFMEVELQVGTPNFRDANEKLLHKALEKGDTKAQTLYYVERLKHQLRVLRSKQRGIEADDIDPKDDELALKSMKELLTIARKFDYPQYYYYAYDLVQNYFYNSHRFLKVTELVQEMQHSAHENNEPYGVWMGYRYLASMYVAQNDFVSAKQYIETAIEMYQSTSDPTILRQSAARLYCDLADTYPIGSDSVRINIAKARECCKQHLDTLRCTYLEAKLAALDKDIAGYREKRDYCLKDKYLNQVSSTAKLLFKNIDTIIFAAPGDKPQVNINGMSQHLREVKYIANIAENYGFETLAFDLEKRLAAYYEGEISKSNRSKLAELDATLGNRELSDKVAQETRRAEHASRIIVLLTVVILGGALLFSWLHIRRLKLANEKVRLANEAKTRFVQNMSHEVRTPLNAIVGFSQLLSLPDGSFTETEKDDFARHIVNNSKMLTMLLDDILNTSAMDAGSYRIVYEPSECKYMCEAALSSVEHRVQPGVKLYFVPESEHPCPVTTDPRRVQQILINMLTNACKHTAKGEIKLTYSTADEPGFIQFSVTDTGTGVPADQAEAIFGRFTKLNEFVQGTGLGLSICREIAEKMGGKVYLDTTYTQGGARFVFSIPVNPPVQTV